MATSKMEFMVENIRDKEEFKKQMLKNPEISRIEIIGKDSVILESTLTCDRAATVLQEATQSNAILWGLGEGRAAVAMIEGNGIRGVVRFGGVNKNDEGLVDGTIDGLAPGHHNLQIHVSGDLSEGCSSIGPIWKPLGNLGVISAGSNGRSDFKFTIPKLKIDEIIGRSLAVAKENDEKRLACGIIARSAGLFENNKKICACDGITLWDEKYVPSAGGIRKHFAESKSSKSTANL